MKAIIVRSAEKKLKIFDEEEKKTIRVLKTVILIVQRNIDKSVYEEKRTVLRRR